MLLSVAWFANPSGALLADAAKFRVDLARSIKAVTVATVDGGQYLPVYAMLNTTPPVNMVRKILSFRRTPQKRSCLSFSSGYTLSLLLQPMN